MNSRDMIIVGESIEMAVIKLEQVIKEFTDAYANNMSDEALEHYYKAMSPLETTRRLVTDARREL